MVRVLMPNGTLVAVAKVTPLNELRILYNGREVRFCERAIEIGCSNGLGFFLESKVLDNCGMATQDVVLLGNLRNEFVKEVLASLVRQEFVDLTGLQLQKTQLFGASHYVFDNGVSEAYLLHGFEASTCCADPLGYPFGAIPAVNNVEDAEDSEEEDCTDEQFEER